MTDNEIVMQRGLIEWQKAEVERLEAQKLSREKDRDYWMVQTRMAREKVETAKSEAIKEFAEKINEIFLRYAHIHSLADCARKDYIEIDDETIIEMQSVWDVFTLKKYGIAEYEEMNRLQNNIELIEKSRLLAEFEKDFRLFVKEMTG